LIINYEGLIVKINYEDLLVKLRLIFITSRKSMVNEREYDFMIF